MDNKLNAMAGRSPHLRKKQKPWDKLCPFLIYEEKEKTGGFLYGTQRRRKPVSSDDYRTGNF